MKKRDTPDWIVMGGEPGDTAHCRCCGAALRLGLPIEIEVFLAASKAFLKSHSRCRDAGHTEAPNVA